jgi:transcriptional regulator with XRE-family HTH domain
MSNDARLGRILKSARVLAGLSQAQVAARVGLHPTSVSMAERGERSLSAATLARVLRAIAAADNDTPGNAA